MNKELENIRHCPECGSPMKTKSRYSWKDKKLGSFTIRCKPGEFHFCPSCGTELHAYNLCIRMEKLENKRKKELENGFRKV